MTQILQKLKNYKFLNVNSIQNNKEYNCLVNMYVFKCWTIISVVLVVSYIIEYFKGLRTLSYILTFFIFTVGPLVVSYFIHLNLGKDNLDIRNFVVIGYICFYSFTIFTSTSFFAWVYIIPKVSVLIVYSDKILIRKVYLCALGLNFLYILQNLFNNNFDKTSLLKEELITCYEIQIACIILSGVFLYYSCECLVYRENFLYNLQKEVYKDSGVDAYNKRFFTNEIPVLFKEAQSYSLAFIDIDNFKQFNDDYNHEFGDLVLKNIANIINEVIVDMDCTYFIRVGGDEFIIITKERNYLEFQNKIELIREKIYFSKLKFEDQEVGIHVSIGLANTIENDCDNYLDLYNKADEKLYEAKKSGKNTIKR